MLVGLYENNDEEIVAAGLGKSHIYRLDNEPMHAFIMRASKTLKMRVLFAVYRNGREAD